MAKEKLGTGEILSKFFDDGAYTPLLASGAVEVAHGCAGGQPVYAVCQNGGPLTVKDVDETLATAKENGLLDETSCDLDGQGALRIFYQINDFGREMVDKYL